MNGGAESQPMFGVVWFVQMGLPSPSSTSFGNVNQQRELGCGGVISYRLRSKLKTITDKEVVEGRTEDIATYICSVIRESVKIHKGIEMEKMNLCLPLMALVAPGASMRGMVPCTQLVPGHHITLARLMSLAQLALKESPKLQAPLALKAHSTIGALLLLVASRPLPLAPGVEVASEVLTTFGA